jgi:hypothetical protein
MEHSPPPTPMSASSHHHSPPSEFGQRSHSQTPYFPPTPQSARAHSSDSTARNRPRSHSLTIGGTSVFSTREGEQSSTSCPNCHRSFSPERYHNGRLMKWCLQCRQQKRHQRRRRHERTQLENPGKKVCISCNSAYSPPEKHSCKAHYREKRMRKSSLSVYGLPSASSGSLSTPPSASSFHGSFRVGDASGSQFSPISYDLRGGPSSAESIPYQSSSLEEGLPCRYPEGREECDGKGELHNIIQQVENLLATPGQLSESEIRDSLERMVAPYRSRPHTQVSTTSRSVCTL